MLAPHGHNAFTLCFIAGAKIDCLLGSPWVVFLAPVWQRLELLDGYLSEFDASGADTSGSKVKWQQKKKTPWMVKEEFPAGEDSKGEQQRGRRIAL